MKNRPLNEYKDIRLSDGEVYSINNKTFWGGNELDLIVLSEYFKVNLIIYQAMLFEVDTLNKRSEHIFEGVLYEINLFKTPGHWDLLIPANEDINQDLNNVLDILKNEIDRPLLKPEPSPNPKPEPNSNLNLTLNQSQ